MFPLGKGAFHWESGGLNSSFCSASGWLSLDHSFLTICEKEARLQAKSPCSSCQNTVKTMDGQGARESWDRDRSWADTGIKQTSQVLCRRTKAVLPWLQTFLVSCSIGLNASTSCKGSTVVFLFTKFFLIFLPQALKLVIYPSFLYIFLSVCYKKDTVPSTGATEEKINHCCHGDTCQSFNAFLQEKWAR